MAAKFGLLIDAKTKGENNIKRLGNSMQGVEGKAKNLGMAVRGVGSAFKALFAAAAVAGFSAFVKGAIDSADAFGKLSTRTGIAADKLQAYANAGKLADVSQSDLETGLRTLARTQGEAADGVKTYSEAYAKLGLSVKQADGSLKPSDQLLGEIADKFADLPNGPEKAAIAMDIFGRSGSKLITLLNGGTEALERFNYETSENFAQNAEYFNDQISILQIQFEGFRMQLADALLPALNAILEVFSDLFDSGTDFGPLFKTIEIGVRGVGAVVLGLVQSMRFFTRVLTDLVAIANLVRQGKFGEALNVAQVGLEDTRSQFFKDMQAQQKVLFGSSEAGASYFQRSTGGFTPVQIDSGGTLDKTTEKAGKNTKEMSVDLAIFLADLEASVAAADQLEKEQFAAGAALAEQLNKQDELNSKLTESQQLFEDMKTTVKEGLGNAIMGLIEGTKTLGQSLSGILRQLGSMFLQFGMGKLFSFLPFAKGGVFAQNNVVPFAYGGVVNKPTLFPMARGMGLMGEAGPEAIMPLRRGRGGRLGVEAAGGGATTVNVSVDASGSSVQGDSAQASQLGKAIGVAVQTEILKQKRPGGLLATV
nr:phage-related minor tail protein [uncultured Mediterranean phage uvMED]